MWEKIRVMYTIPELRRKILLTLVLLGIYRIGFWIPLIVVDQARMKVTLSESASTGLGRVLTQVATFSATQLDQATIFGLGIMPYISASIIFQLMASVYKPLEELQKEGESGRKKINEYTRYATVVLCIFQSILYIRFLIGQGAGGESLIRPEFLNPDGGLPITWWIVTVMTMTAGTVFLMWLGEQIDEYGIGNGISLLIMAGILARMPSAGWTLIQPIFQGGLQLGGGGGQMGAETLIVLAALFVAVIMGVVFITQGQRRIPTQSGKHMRGRRQYGGGARQYLPLRVNQAGVMPIIFASSLLLLPGMLFSALGNRWPFFADLAQTFLGGKSFLYSAMYIGLIFFFCYFWTAITFNPKDIAENLKSVGSFIQGYRPGKRTAEYLEKVMVRITYVGAAFLAVVAILPSLVANMLGIDFMIASFYGGTGLLIAVSVAFDLVQKIDAHLVMRNYKGLLE